MLAITVIAVLKFIASVAFDVFNANNFAGQARSIGIAQPTIDRTSPLV